MLCGNVSLFSIVLFQINPDFCCSGVNSENSWLAKQSATFLDSIASRRSPTVSSKLFVSLKQKIVLLGFLRCITVMQSQTRAV